MIAKHKIPHVERHPYQNFCEAAKCHPTTQLFQFDINKASEDCLNREILNNSVKRKAMEDMCVRPCHLIHRELLGQDLDTVTYKDIRNISRNMHKSRFSQLLPLPTDIVGVHETLSAVQVLTGSKEQFFCLLITRK
jgi:hypothetical protein